jgi:hypothetical protein
VILELGLLIPFPHHPFKAAVIGGLLLFLLYLIQAGRVAFARDRRASVTEPSPRSAYLSCQ